MKIGIDASWTCGQLTGTGVYARTLIESTVPALAPHPLTLYFRHCCPDGNPLYADTRHHRRIVGGHRVWRSIAGLGGAISRDHLDLFISPVCFAPLTARCPVIVTLFDTSVFCMGRFWWRRRVWRQYLSMRVLTGLSLHKAARIVTISHATRDALATRFPALEPRLRVIYPGVEGGGEALPGDADGLPPLPLPYALYVGVMSPTKNLERVVRAIAQLKRGHNPLSLVLAGRDSGTYMRRQLQPLIRDLGLEDRVLWLGFVSDRQREALYRGATVLAFPSLLEGFGYPIVEAMCRELPVVTSTRSSCPEVAGGAALCVDPFSVEAIAAALGQVSTDATLRERLVAAGRARWREFSPPRMRDGWLKLIAEFQEGG